MVRLRQSPVSPLWLKREDREEGEQGTGVSVLHLFLFSPQTNRLSDVIVFRDDLCVWADTCGGGGTGEGSSVKIDLYVGGVGGLLPKATWRLCILHTMVFLCCIYLVSSSFLSYANTFSASFSLLHFKGDKPLMFSQKRSTFGYLKGGCMEWWCFHLRIFLLGEM